MRKSLKVTAISDLHGYLPKGLPDGDVLCICGDIMPLDHQTSTTRSLAWFIQDFTPWTDSLKNQGYKDVLLIPGNHDFMWQNLKLGIHYSGSEIIKSIYLHHKGEHIIKLLCDNSVDIEGWRFYGTPWIPELSTWAYYGDSQTLANKFSNIAKKCSVLLSHCPPKYGSQGKVNQTGWNYGRDFGCQELLNAIKTREIEWVISGHVHSGMHEIETMVTDSGFETKMVNVSLLNEDYRPAYEPFTFELK